MDDISDSALFCAIVDAGGISAGALALGSSPAAVSLRLSGLETKLGVRLAERSSRRLRLTDVLHHFAYVAQSRALWLLHIHASTIVIHADHADLQPLRARNLSQRRQTVHAGAVRP